MFNKKVLSPYKTVLITQLPTLYSVFVDLLSLSFISSAISCLERLANRAGILKFQNNETKNRLWNFAVDAHAQFTHSVVDLSINVLNRLACCQGNRVKTAFCGPARDTLLSNHNTEKLNFDCLTLTI